MEREAKQAGGHGEKQMAAARGPQNVGGPGRTSEIKEERWVPNLAGAVVGDPDAVHASTHGRQGVLGRVHALDHDLHRGVLMQRIEIENKRDTE